MLIFLRVLGESFNFAINALKNNLLRTFLSLLGVTIGIFSIIGVLAAVDSLKNEISGSLNSLDNSTTIVMRFNFGPTDIPRWKWQQFPDVTYDEYQFLKRNLPEAKAVTFTQNVPAETIKYKDASSLGVDVVSAGSEIYDIEAINIEEGRFFNESEAASGSPVIVMGSEIAENLFGSIDPIGKQVRMYGRKFTVIGLLKKEGASMFGGSKDSQVYVPVNVTRRIYGENNRNIFPQILLKPESDVDNAEFLAILEQRLRTFRGIKPGEVSTFFVNQLKGFTDMIDNITGTLNLIGLVISGFSLLVGGFGIANIMFVSVKERTNLIGIQKSLGAKNKFILFQFLFEAIILAIIGGAAGLFFVWVTTIIVSNFTGDFEFILSFGNIVLGTTVSAIIGLVSGIIPAISASRLDPVEAIRTGM
ncbi:MULTISPECIES: ABC transporter permease [unclassified Zunongwangia]|uniref:ABC transporter permease n=1 Tax=unclassified Zunongwangia TaxID=2632541 RepID=UPI0022DE01F3|nr:MULTISPECIES: ABC transporter permease [unclassified Zunongwangia]WBL21944.1 ABC transporter permease [Zunongwangia sp. HRR-M8]WBL26103.1 ABC transporter permease [Zunongwangia sp. HGR-M22]